MAENTIPPATNSEMSKPTLNSPGLISGKGLTDEFFIKAGLDSGSSAETIMLVRAPFLPSFKNSEGIVIHPPFDNGLLEDPKQIPIVSQDGLPIDKWATDPTNKEDKTRKVCPMTRANTLISPTLGNLTAPIGQVLVSPAEYELITFSYSFDELTSTLFDSFGQEVTLETLFFNKLENKEVGESAYIWLKNYGFQHDYWWYPTITISNQPNAEVNEKILPEFPHYTYVNNKTGRTFISINNLLKWDTMDIKVGDDEGKKPYEVDCIYTRFRSFLAGAENIWDTSGGDVWDLFSEQEKVALILGEGCDDEKNRWEFPGVSIWDTLTLLQSSPFWEDWRKNYFLYSLYITAILRGGWCWLSMQAEDNPEAYEKSDACNERRTDYTYLDTGGWRRDGSPAGDPELGFTTIDNSNFEKVYYLYKIDRFGNEMRIDENYFVDTALKLSMARYQNNPDHDSTISKDILEMDKTDAIKAFKKEFDPPFLIEEEKKFYDALRRGTI